MYYASDSPSAMVFQDSPVQHLDEDNLLNLEQTTNVMMDPVLGPIVCTLSTEDTEIPNLDDSLALPIVESPLIYASEGEGREDDLLDCTSPDDEIDIPGSPSEFHVYEELESPDMLEAKVCVSICSFCLPSFTLYCPCLISHLGWCSVNCSSD
jgi:hypothetical protein